MKNLGTMNGWTSEPEEYTKHRAECGHLISKPLSGGGVFEFRKYNTTEAVRNCWHTVKCWDCGCTWSYDSSD